MVRFELAGGSVQGTNHRRSGRNNQDSWSFWQYDQVTTAIVCDGCSSSKYAEVGAQLGSQLLGQALTRQILRHVPEHDDEVTGCLEKSRQDVLAQLRVLARGMGDSLSQTTTDYFLFTTLGAVITARKAWFFSIGDGVMVINGVIHTIGPFANNQPPYLGYGLLDPATVGSVDPITFTLHHSIPTPELESFLIGTDGVGDLAQLTKYPLPGKPELVGELNQFWLEDRYFRNPEAINRRLRLINQDTIVLEPQTQALLRHDRGLLPDDTTFITGRRTP